MRDVSRRANEASAGSDRGSVQGGRPCTDRSPTVPRAAPPCKSGTSALRSPFPPLLRSRPRVTIAWAAQAPTAVVAARPTDRPASLLRARVAQVRAALSSRALRFRPRPLAGSGEPRRWACSLPPPTRFVARGAQVQVPGCCCCYTAWRPVCCSHRRFRRRSEKFPTHPRELWEARAASVGTTRFKLPARRLRANIRQSRSCAW
jgi:hypothetical protein